MVNKKKSIVMSAVIHAYNEEGNVRHLYNEIKLVMFDFIEKGKIKDY